MRLTPAAMLLSDEILNRPISPVRRTCVPPHGSSLLKSGIDYDANIRAVFFAEQRHCAGGNCLVERHHVGGDCGVAQNLIVHDALDLGDFGRIDGSVMAEIEAQARRLHNATCLLNVRAEYLAKRGVQQMRRRVIALGGEACSLTATSARSSASGRRSPREVRESCAL